MPRLLIVLVLATSASAAQAATTAKDAQIIAKALGFLDPSPAGGVLAVAYNAADPASKADAEATAALFAGGLAEGSNSVTAKAVDTSMLGQGIYIAILTEHAPGPAIMQAAVAHRIPCITIDSAAVQAGRCVMSVQADPKVEIIVNHEAAQSSGVSFQPAFRMLVHEI